MIHLGDALILLRRQGLAPPSERWVGTTLRLNLALTQQNNKCLDKARQTFQEGTRMAAGLDQREAGLHASVVENAWDRSCQGRISLSRFLDKSLDMIID